MLGNLLSKRDELLNRSEHYVTDQGEPVLQYVSTAGNAPTLTQRYFYADNGQPLAVDNVAQQSLVWQLSDTFGTVRDLFGQAYTGETNAGELQNLGHITFTSFGQVTDQGLSAALNITPVFRGRTLDPSSGLYLDGDRYYDPRSNTFVSPDGYGQTIDGSNSYAAGKVYSTWNPRIEEEAAPSLFESPWQAYKYYGAQAYRGMLGDAYLAQMSDAEMYGMAFFSGATIYATGALAAGSGLAAAVGGGAIGGAVEYVGVQGIANFGDMLRGRDDAQFTASGLAQNTVFGAFGGGIGYGLGLTAQASVRYIVSHSGPVMQVGQRVGQRLWNEVDGALGLPVSGPRTALAVEESAVEARGGVYLLRNLETDQIMRTGRTNDLLRRKGEHFRDPALKDYRFEPVYRTDVYAEQRGLEQELDWLYNPPLNYNRPINPYSANLPRYLRAANDYLDRVQGVP